MSSWYTVLNNLTNSSSGAAKPARPSSANAAGSSAKAPKAPASLTARPDSSLSVGSGCDDSDHDHMTPAGSDGGITPRSARGGASRSDGSSTPRNVASHPANLDAVSAAIAQMLLTDATPAQRSGSATPAQRSGSATPAQRSGSATPVGVRSGNSSAIQSRGTSTPREVPVDLLLVAPPSRPGSATPRVPSAVVAETPALAGGSTPKVRSGTSTPRAPVVDEVVDPKPAATRGRHVPAALNATLAVHRFTAAGAAAAARRAADAVTRAVPQPQLVHDDDEEDDVAAVPLTEETLALYMSNDVADADAQAAKRALDLLLSQPPRAAPQGFSMPDASVFYAVMNRIYDSLDAAFGVARPARPDTTMQTVADRMLAGLLQSSAAPTTNMVATTNANGRLTRVTINLPTLVSGGTSNELSIAILDRFAMFLNVLLKPAVPQKEQFDSISGSSSSEREAPVTESGGRREFFDGFEFMVDPINYCLQHIKELKDDRTRFSGLGLVDTQEQRPYFDYVPSHKFERASDVRINLDSVMELFYHNPLYTPLVDYASAIRAQGVHGETTKPVLLARHRANTHLATFRQQLVLDNGSTAASLPTHNVINIRRIQSEEQAEATDAEQYARGLVQRMRTIAFGGEQCGVAGMHSYEPRNPDEAFETFIDKTRGQVATSYIPQRKFFLTLVKMFTMLPLLFNRHDESSSVRDAAQMPSLLRVFLRVGLKQRRSEAREPIAKRAELYHRVLAVLKVDVEDYKSQNDAAIAKAFHLRQQNDVENAARYELLSKQLTCEWLLCSLSRELVMNRLISLIVKRLYPLDALSYIIDNRDLMSEYLPHNVQDFIESVITESKTPTESFLPVWCGNPPALAKNVVCSQELLQTLDGISMPKSAFP